MMNDEEKRTMEILRSDNVELAKTIESLKRQIGGYKASNEEYRKKIEHLKYLCKEGDELYEGKIAEMEEMRKMMLAEIKELTNASAKAQELSQTIERKDDFIETLQAKVQTLTIEKSDLESTVSSQKALIDDMDETISYLRTPWWRRLFR